MSAVERVPPRDEWILPALERLLSAEALETLRSTAGASLWQAAVRRKLVADSTLLTEAAKLARLRVWDGRVAPDHARDLVPEQWARRFHVVPVALAPSMLTVATSTPHDMDCDSALAFATGRTVDQVIASPLAIAAGLDALYGPGAAQARDVHLAAESGTGGEADGTAVSLVDALIADGISARASDIHLEREEHGVAVRHRVDGVLRHVRTIEPEHGLPLVSRIKIMAGLDIADRLRPQDGRVTIPVGAGQVDLRVSTLPAAHGEKVVLRVLDARAGGVSLDGLGLSAPSLARVHHVLDAREGIVLVTGPTGSGKTTTLYAALRAIQRRGVNIVTIEDPIEYRLPGIVQVQITARTGLTFGAALRSILRQDPDVILVGEIRDAETASIAVQAALTGHLVLSTLHTIDAAGAIARLDDLGVDRYKIAAALRGVVAQRLLRRLCPECRVRDDAPVRPALERWFPPSAPRWVERGCRACSGTGYRGRLAVVEALQVGEPVEREIASGSPVDLIADAARAAGMIGLFEAGVEQVLAGTTTAAEIGRVLEQPLPRSAEALLREARARLREHTGVTLADRSEHRAGGPLRVQEPSRAAALLAALDDFDLTEAAPAPPAGGR